MASKSSVWKYFDVDSTDRNKTICKRCSKKLSYSHGSTSTMKNHLKSVHNINPDLNEHNEPSTSKRVKTIHDFVKKESLEEIVAKLAAKDGFSINAITKSGFIRQKIAEMNYHLPKNPSDVMALIHKHFETIKSDIKQQIQVMITNREKFSLTLDEWTSVKMRKYLNINIHAHDGTWFNLGLVRISGRADAKTLQDLVRAHLSSFGISFDKDIVACTSDGAAVMVKFGHESPTIMQLCYNHAIHLAVLDTITEDCDLEEVYSDASDNSTDSEFEEELISSDSSSKRLSSIMESKLKPLRIVVKFFKRSTVKNNLLQIYVKDEHGTELELLLDVKTRWNSIAPMIERALKIKGSLQQALEELGRSDLWEAIDMEFLEELLSILSPIKLTVEALSRSDCNLMTAEGAMNFLTSKLQTMDTDWSDRFLQNITTRISQRKNESIVSVMKFVQSPSSQPRQVLETSANLLKRLYPVEPEEVEAMDQDVVHVQEEYSLVDELNAAISAATTENLINPGFDKLKQEFNIFKLTGNKTENVILLQNALKTIRPTSTESERTFSLANNFCTKIRSKLSDKSLNALVFLKSHFLK